MEATLMQLATQIAEQQAHLQWQLWLSAVALAIVCVFVAAYLKSYSSKVADIKAQTDKLPEMQHVLAETTRTTAQIKEDIAQAKWSEREMLTTRRTKLEELLHAAYEAEQWYNEAATKAFEGGRVDVYVPALTRVMTTGSLYFPDLNADLERLEKACRDHHLALCLCVVQKEKLANGGNPLDPSIAEKAGTAIKEVFLSRAKVSDALIELRQAASRTMHDILARRVAG